MRSNVLPVCSDRVLHVPVCSVIIFDNAVATVVAYRERQRRTPTVASKRVTGNRYVFMAAPRFGTPLYTFTRYRAIAFWVAKKERKKPVRIVFPTDFKPNVPNVSLRRYCYGKRPAERARRRRRRWETLCAALSLFSLVVFAVSYQTLNSN